MTRTIRLCAAAALLAACSHEVIDPLAGEQLAFIQIMEDGTAQVTVPAVAQRGQPFEVSVITVGGGCVSQGPTRTRTEGMTAEVRPYDVHDGNLSCTPNILFFEHTATLRFDTPGTATVHIVGAGNLGPEPITVTRTVTIQ